MKSISIPTLWRSLVIENPMTVEIKRFRRKFLTVTPSRAGNSALLVLVILGYGLLTWTVMTARGSIPPSAVLYIQTGVFVILGPALLHASIAGEREKRTWDVLLVAPVTHAQIVFGKFLGAFAAVIAIAVATLFPMLIAAVTYASGRYSFGVSVTHIDLYNLFLSDLLSISFGLLVCAFTILFSARVKRPLAALGTTFGVLAVTLIGVPTLTAIAVGGDMVSSQFILYGHPFFAQSMIRTEVDGYSPQNGLSPHLFGWPHILIYLGLTIVALAWATNTLVFAENDVKFIPRSQDA